MLYNERKRRIANFYIFLSVLSMIFMLFVDPIKFAMEVESASIFFSAFFSVFLGFEIYVYLVGLFLAIAIVKGADTEGGKKAFIIVVLITVLMRIASSASVLIWEIDYLIVFGAFTEDGILDFVSALIHLVLVFMIMFDFITVLIDEGKELFGRRDKRNGRNNRNERDDGDYWS